MTPSWPPPSCLTSLGGNDVPEVASSESNKQSEEDDVQIIDEYGQQESVQFVDTGCCRLG